MLEIIFESHATSVDNEKQIASGWLDPPLSKKGRDQAKELGRRHEKKTFSFICVSDLSRSYDTAQIAFGNRSIPVIKDSRLREWNYGQFNGSPAAEVDKLKLNHMHTPFPNGESLEQAIGRFLSFEKEFFHSALENPILMIGHRATYYSLEFYLKKIPLKTLLTASWKWQPGWHYLKTEL